MKPRFTSVKNYIIRHKIISSVGLLVIIFGGYWVYGKATATTGETRYVTATVGRDTIISTITGTGQVSASNQVDLTPKVSGDVTYVGVVAGQQVHAGQEIVAIDSTTAQKAVRDAQLNLQTAQLSLQKMQEPTDTLTLTQTQDALTQATSDLQKSYTDGNNSVSSAFLDLPTIMTGMQNILYGTDISHGGQDNISAYHDLITQYATTSDTERDVVVAAYTTARNAYTKNLSDYHAFNPATASTDAVSALIQETYTTTEDIANAVKTTNDYLNYIKDTLTLYNKQIPSALTTAQTSLSTYTGEVNSHTSDLLGIISTITTSTQSITEKTESLAKLQAGADPIDVQSSQLSITQRENTLQDAKDTLANYYITAPFDGTVAKVDVQVGDSAGNSAVATLITTKQLADISLNEVDVAKIKVGDKATLTFDAITGLTITGQVAQINSIGTVTQGVVTYDVKISFDTQDTRILPGMSVSAAIITNVVPNVVVVPNSALKTQGGTAYVQVFNPPITVDPTTANQGSSALTPPQNVSVTTGASNNTETEITGGLQEGDQIVTRTIAPTAAKTTTTAPTLLGATGVRAGGAAGAGVGGGAGFRGGAGATTGR